MPGNLYKEQSPEHLNYCILRCHKLNTQKQKQTSNIEDIYMNIMKFKMFRRNSNCVEIIKFSKLSITYCLLIRIFIQE